jgi:hypothetical protein
LSSLISTAIDPKEARLGLTICCITYLCQSHHDRSIEPAKVFDLALTGSYRLHNFAVMYWLILLDEVLSTFSLDALPAELTILLNTLRDKRKTVPSRKLEVSSIPRYMARIRKRRPELATMLCNSISFQAMCDKSSFRTRASKF